MADPVKVAEETLARIAACEDRAIFTCITRDRALTEARAAARRIAAREPHGPLDGMPIAWKDLFDLQGLPTTAGSAVLAEAPRAARDAAVVENLAKAGMVTVGRTNMTEFAYSGLGLNSHFGTPRNPHGTEPRVPGGSSSGSAVAVARGLVPIAIGTDTGGSVRLPAAVNGVVGFKASTGRYAMTGVFPLSPTLDSLGVFSRTVEAAALVDAGMRGVTPASPTPRPLNGVRLLVPTNIVLDDCEPAVLANFEAAIDRLARAGAVIERGALPAFDEIMRLGDKRGAILAAEAYAIHQARLDSDQAARMDRRVVTRLRLGARIGLADYLAVTFARRQLIAETAARLAGCFVAFPTTPIVAPAIAPLERDEERFFAANARILRNTSLGNFLDWCGVSLPTGSDEAGMPTSLLFSATAGQDEGLLSLALGCERIVMPGE
ncbi:MAG TPA: amidase [Stellaceae bacterium]|nr:amidase [Stellaceae bacterium]